MAEYATPATCGVDHVGLSVRDLESSRRFFCDCLGWRVVGERPECPAAFVSDGQLIVTLWRVEAPDQAVAFDRRTNVGLHHLAWISQTREVHRGCESERIVVRQRFPHDPRCAPMQTECTPKLFEFEAVERHSVVAGFDGGNITSNAGALLLGQVDRGVGLVRRFANCFIDRRDPRYVEHQVETLVGQRIFGLALGYEDLNDHDELRKDPTFAVLAGKLSPVLRTNCEPLAGKSTLNRLEHTPRRQASKYHKIDCDGAQVDALLVDLFLEAHQRAPREIVLDLDNTDIPLHGEQEGRFFHGYYEEYCYLPLYVFCGRHLLLARQRRANVAGSDGAVAEIARIVAQIRHEWPRVRIILRADSGFSNDELMGWCEANRVDYVFGLARNRRLEAALVDQLAAAKRLCAASGRPARVFRDFWYLHARQLEPHPPGCRQGRAHAGGRQSSLHRLLAQAQPHRLRCACPL